MAGLGLPLDRAIDDLVLNPLSPLHEEPDRLLREDLPPAVALRPVLDAIGLGAHRVSEIAARIQTPATSLSRPLQRLMELDLVQRETPFGAPSASARRSLYKIADPFCRSFLVQFPKIMRNHGGIVKGRRVTYPDFPATFCRMASTILQKGS